jgi:hypothetical protein
MTTVMNKTGMRCPSCKYDNALDIQAIVWVRLTPNGTDADLPEDGSHEWDNASAARCSACGWEGTAGDTLIRKTKSSDEKGPDPEGLRSTTSAARFSCPAGHTGGLQESHELHVWFPIDAVTGQADHTIPLSELEASDVDEDATSDGCFYCPTCNETFPELVEIGTTSERNRSA